MSSQLTSFCSDWLHVFPLLHRYKGGRKLILRSGTIVYGIELRKIFAEVYRPEFICLNLLSCINEFTLTREFAIPGNPQADIEHRHHSRDFAMVAQTVKEQIPLLSTPAPRAQSIIDLYRAHVDYYMSTGANAVALMISLVQQTIYFDLPDLEATEREELSHYFDSLPEAVRSYLSGSVAKELSLTADQLRQNMRANVAKAGWPDTINETEPDGGGNR